jgi:hypothetical protein
MEEEEEDKRGVRNGIRQRDGDRCERIGESNFRNNRMGKIRGKVSE